MNLQAQGDPCQLNRDGEWEKVSKLLSLIRLFFPSGRLSCSLSFSLSLHFFLFFFDCDISHSPVLDECAPSSSSSSAKGVVPICLNLRCTQKDVPIGEPCQNDNTVYTVFLGGGATAGDVVSR